MNLVTPDLGLLFWMVLIFGIVFFILAKYGFPVITGMVEKRSRHIDEALQKAREAEQRMAHLAKEQEALVEKSMQEQSRILKEAAQTRQHILAEAKADAQALTDKLLAKARTEIAAEKEGAIRDIRLEMAELSMKIAEKVIRKDLSSDEAQQEYLHKIIDEVYSDNAALRP